MVLNPMRPPSKILNVQTPNIIYFIVIELKIGIFPIKNTGPNFCKLEIKKQPPHSKPPITQATHLAQGDSPTFTIKDRNKNPPTTSGEVGKLDNLVPTMYILDPTAWIKK